MEQQLGQSTASKIMVGNFRLRIDSFETEPAIEEFRTLIKAAAENATPLEFLSFSGNSYGSQFFLEIELYLQKIPTITKLALEDIFTQRTEDLNKSLEILSRVLTGKKIKALDISNNAICPSGCKEIFEFLKSLKDLEYFWANNSALAQNGSIFIAKALEEGESKLKVLSATRNRIEVKAVDFGKAIRKLKNLEQITLSQNGIKTEGMSAILDACITAENLKKLELNDNWILEGAVDKLCELIIKNKSLEEINIGDCNITEAANTKIIEALKQGGQKWVGFGHDYNELVDEDLTKEFIQVLVKPGTLKWLSVKGNEFSENSVKATNDLIKSNVEHEVKVEFESDYEDLSDDDAEEVDPVEVIYQDLIKKFQNLKL